MKILYAFLLASLFMISTHAQIIVIDPGHGYGATTADNPDGRTATEIETSLEVGLRTRALIQTSCTWTVQMTRTTNLNSWTSVTQRATMANNWNADRLLSIHCNAGGGTGTETFYCTTDDTTTAPDIAFAQKIQTDMVTNGVWNNRRCVEDNSFLGYHLGVLRYSAATGCLNELGFVDSSDATKLTSNTWRDTFALSYFNTFKSNLNLTCTATVPAPGAFTLSLTPECSGNTSQIKLMWTAAVNATAYDIYRNGTLLASNITGTQFTNTTVTSGTTYTYSVKAKNSGAIQTNNSNGIVSATASNCAIPGAFTMAVSAECSATVTSQMNVTWTSSNGATSYDIYRNGTLYASDISGTSFLNTYLITGGTSYSYSVKAKNAIGQTTNSNGPISATAINCPPAAFTLTVTPTCSGTTSAMSLTWTAATGATSYDIYRNGNLYASNITGTSFLNTYLITAGTSYSFAVKAKNNNGSTNNLNGTISKVAINCSGAKTEEIKNNLEPLVTIYPNPTLGEINFNIANTKEKSIEISIFNVAGKNVITKQLAVNDGEINHTLNLNDLPNGIYVLRMNLDGKEITKKIIKQ